MKVTNPIKFLLYFCICYFSLVVVHEIKAVRSLHNSFFISVEQSVFNLFNPNTRIELSNYTQTPGVPYMPDSYDHSFTIFDKAKYKRARNKENAKPISLLNASLDNTSIGPLILFISLLIATPVVWKRKVIYGLLGILLVYILISLKYSFLFYENIESLSPIGLWGLLSKTFGGAFRSHEFLLLNVLFIWALVSIRSKEFKWFLS